MAEDRFSPLIRGLRTFVQGLGAAALIAGGEAAYTAVAGGTYNPRLVIMAVVVAVVGSVVTYLYNHLAPKLGISGSPSWEGLIRAGRTIVQTIVAVGLVAAWDAAYVVVSGGNYSPADIVAAGWAALLTAVVAYLHNLMGTRKVARA